MLQSANAILRLGQNSSWIVGAALGGLVVAATSPGIGIAVDAGTFFLAAFFTAPHPASDRAAHGDVELLRRAGRRLARVQLAHVALGDRLAVRLRERDRAGHGGSSRPGDRQGSLRRSGRLGPHPDRPIARALRRWPHPASTPPAAALAHGHAGLPAHDPVSAGSGRAASARRPSSPPPRWPGIGVEIFGIMWDTTMQQEIPQEKLSRVYSYDALGSFVLIPLRLRRRRPGRGGDRDARDDPRRGGDQPYRDPGGVDVRDVRTLPRRETTEATDA